VLAVKASTYELLVLSIFYIAAVVFFGFFVYYAERFLSPKRIDAPITNIPLGLWYSLITVTTVGYGDTYPVTWGGYVLGVMCQLVGVILLALTIPVISSNFLTFYAYAKSRDPRRLNAKPRDRRRSLLVSEKGEKTEDEEAEDDEVVERTTTIANLKDTSLAAMPSNRLRDNVSSMIIEEEVEERTTHIGTLPSSKLRNAQRLIITEENESDDSATRIATLNNKISEAGQSRPMVEEDELKDRPSSPVVMED